MWIPAEQVDPCKDGKSHLGSSVYLTYLWRVWRSFLNFMQDHAGNMLEGPGRVMLCPWNYFVRSTVPASLASSGGGDTSTKAYWDSGAVTILPRPGAILVFVPGLRESWLLWLAGASASSCPVHRSFATWEYQDLFREEGRSGARCAKTHCAIARQFPRYSKYAIKKKNNGATIFPRTTRGKNCRGQRTGFAKPEYGHIKGKSDACHNEPRVQYWFSSWYGNSRTWTFNATTTNYNIYIYHILVIISIQSLNSWVFSFLNRFYGLR